MLILNMVIWLVGCQKLLNRKLGRQALIVNDTCLGATKTFCYNIAQGPSRMYTYFKENLTLMKPVTKPH